MKHKIFALVLALTVASWAQTATQTPSTPQPGATQADKASCACCDKMAASVLVMRRTPSLHPPSASKIPARKPRLHSRDGSTGHASTPVIRSKWSRRSAKDKTVAACCGTPGKACGKGCCSSDKKEKTAKNCCGDAVRS